MYEFFVVVVALGALVGSLVIVVLWKPTNKNDNKELRKSGEKQDIC